MEIKIEMLSHYQLNIEDLYNIPIGNVKKIVRTIFVKEKYVFIMKTCKKIHRVLEFNQSQWLKQHVEFNTQNRCRKNGDKDEKVLHKLMKDAVY